MNNSGQSNRIKKMSKPKIVFMPHANIQYSQLKPEKRQWVMKNSYEKLFDVALGGDYRIAFEASGRTIELMAEQAPEALAKLKTLVKEGKIEPVSSPHTLTFQTPAGPLPRPRRADSMSGNPWMTCMPPIKRSAAPCGATALPASGHCIRRNSWTARSGR